MVLIENVRCHVKENWEVCLQRHTPYKASYKSRKHTSMHLHSEISGTSHVTDV